MKIDFVIASSDNFAGFHSTNVKHPIHGYASRTAKEMVEFIKENWPDSTMTSANLFDIDEADRRAYKDTDAVYTNKIEHRLKQLEADKIIMLQRKKNLTRS